MTGSEEAMSVAEPPAQQAAIPIRVAVDEGQVLLDGEDVNSPQASAVEVRRRVGLVFQRPNPFPMTIYDNVAYGPRRHGVSNRGELDEIVERSIRSAALWDEV